MSIEKAGGYISKIVFNNGSDIDLQPNDIVVFVGPNNAGKSQSLKDIYNLCNENFHKKVVTEISIKKYSTEFDGLFNKLSAKTKGEYPGECVFLGRSYFLPGPRGNHFYSNPLFAEYRDLFVANLDTSARLTICDPPSSISRNSPEYHPIHYAAFNSNHRKWLSNNFKKAFGINIAPNILYGEKIPLILGEPVKLNKDFQDEQERQETYAEVIKDYPQVQDQGDEIKSFTGILLYLMLDNFCTFLIDEPESFLHPPQAYIMGQIIGNSLSDQQQCFLSTHSEEIIKGLLEACPERIKIIRITRKENNNSFSVLDNAKFLEVWKDPLLKYSNIMSSLFHNTVVLCESDSDCKMYSIIDSHLKHSVGKYSETLFIHCGGKQRMAKIANALRLLNIDIRLIVDIDVLNDEKVLSGIAEAFDVKWNDLTTDYNILVSNLHSGKDKINRKDATNLINSILQASKNKDLTEKEIRNIREIIKTSSKWDGIKSAGINAIPPGDATEAFQRLNKTLQEHGIHIVPVGKLECFIKTVGGHGPEWTNKVLEKYPSLKNPVYKEIKKFIKQIKI